MIADEAKKQAEARRKESDANAARAQAARAEADQSAAEAGAVVDFMVNGVLGAAAPSRTKGETLTVLQALEQADKAVEGRFAKEPRVEAAVRMALASVYSELGEYERAAAACRAGPRTPREGPGSGARGDPRGDDRLGWACYKWGTHDQLRRGEALYRRMLEICRRTHKDDDHMTHAMNGLAAILGGLEGTEEALVLQEKHPGTPEEVCPGRRTPTTSSRCTTSPSHS